jgi:3-keto-disaccharide hydrolase
LTPARPRLQPAAGNLLLPHGTRTMRTLLFVSLPLLVLALPAPADDKPDDKGFVSIFNGKDLTGWHVSAESGHSRTSGNKTGGKWVVTDGAIVGSQDTPGNGGIVITDKKYRNFEIVLEMNNDFGPDSGLFLRGNEKGQAYQAMIDYYAGGNLMGVYGEGIGGFHHRNFTFGAKPTEITENKSPVPLPVKPEDWPAFWKHGEWNELRARIVGNPPAVTTWIKGKKFMEFTDDKKRLPDEGGIALQVHGGGDFTKQFVRYRNIRVKVLD